MNNKNTKQCIFCGETIAANAIECEYCFEKQPPNIVNSEESQKLFEIWFIAYNVGIPVIAVITLCVLLFLNH